jgi:hypothetical protein
MPANEIAGTLFIRENTLLPGGLIIETEAFIPGWRAVINCDGYTLGRKIEQANWNFFFLAGEVTATVFGRVGPSTLRRALAGILSKPAALKFNSLEIAATRSRWFLGIPLVTVAANFRHIQQGLALDRANDFTRKVSAAPRSAAVTDKFETLVSSS